MVKLAPKKNVESKQVVTEEHATVTNNVNKTSKKMKEVVEKKDGGLFDTPPCNVGHSLTYTKNLGNYESLKVEVRISMPCKVEEIDQVFAIEKNWVDTKLAELVAEVEDKL